MAVTKLLNLLAISCLAIIASLGPTPVSALSVDTTHHARHNLHHAVAAKKKRAASSKRCKPRSTAPAPAPASYSTTTKAAAPKPSTTKAAAPKPTSEGSSGGSNSGGGGGGGKAGIAWPLGNDPAIKNFKTWKTDKYYTWSPWCVDHANEVGMHCCPMLWGDKQIGDFTKLVKPGYAHCALGFNEPNQSGQSNMSPQHGADLWRRYLNPLKDQGYYLVSPACTNAPSGKQWIKDFLNSCSGCHVDAIAVHIYTVDPQVFIDYVTDMHNTFNKKIWVTEFAAQNFGGSGGQANYGQVFDFMRKVTAFMDNTPWVENYFAFGAMHDMFNVNPANQLLAGNGHPTDLGRLYIGA